MATTIPRFLLPRGGALWQPRSLQAITFARTASSKTKAKSKAAAAASKASEAPSKQIVLEQPAKFNPPSHGARLRKEAPRYPGPALSSQQREVQSKKQYPNMMPPQGSFLHWFIHNRSIHIWITLGTLLSLAIYTFFTNFRRTSKFGDMLPKTSDIFYHPIDFSRTYWEVLKLHTAAVSAESAERRKRTVDDVQKRGEYRKAHGLETEAVGGWTAKEDDKVTFRPSVNGGTKDAELSAAGAVSNEEDGGLGEHVEQVRRERRPVKKWLGIW